MGVVFFKRRVVRFLLLTLFGCVLYLLGSTLLKDGTCTYQTWPKSWVSRELQPWNNRSGVLNYSTCSVYQWPKSWINGEVTQLHPLVPANCSALFAGNNSEIGRVEHELRSWQNSVSDEQFLQRLTNCTYIKSLFSGKLYISRTELDFPLAFLLTVHDYPQQVTRLLRVLYRPHNVYCIHIDAKANSSMIRAFTKLSQCLPNVLIPRKLTTVFYTRGESILEAQLSCLERLKDAHAIWKWRYVMNLCGTELPLLTNREMVEGLRRMGGKMHIDSDDFPAIMKEDRFTFRYKMDRHSKRPEHDTKDKFGPPPFGMKLHKSTTYNLMSYSFTEFILTHCMATALRDYLKGAGNAEEHFYSTLFRLPQAPVEEASGDIRMKLTASIWEAAPNSNITCRGTFRNEVCIVGVANLNYVYRFLERKNTLFFNKYFASQDHVIMNCLEEHLVRQNQLEYHKDCDYS